METKQLPRKHVGKTVSKAQEKEIKQVQANMVKNSGGKPVAWIQAKHEYFEREERQAKYDPESLKKAGIKTMPEITEDTEMPKRKAVMTIAETKLGVTMVLSKEECKELGIKETSTTKDAIQEIRKRLGLPEKKKRGE